MYEVSDAGEVRRCKAASVRHPVTGRLLKSTLDKTTGYWKLALHDGQGRQHTKAVHVLVCEAFHGPRPAGLDVRHKDDAKSNNRADNLEYGTRRENNLDAVRNGLNTQSNKTHCPYGHPLSMPNINPCSQRDGRRQCRACSHGRAAAQRAAKHGLALDHQEASDAAFVKITAKFQS